MGYFLIDSVITNNVARKYKINVKLYLIISPSQQVQI